MTDPTTLITVPIEGDGLTYSWSGEDAEARHERWALTGEPTYDDVTPTV